MNKSQQMMQTLDEIESEDQNLKVDHLIATDHTHTWEIDIDGNGKSSMENDHSHEVISFLALPCTEDGHEHLLELPASTQETEWGFNEK
jgi:hypothetical protein